MRQSIVTNLGIVTAALLTVSVVIGAVPIISQKSYAAIIEFKQHKDNPTLALSATGGTAPSVTVGAPGLALSAGSGAASLRCCIGPGGWLIGAQLGTGKIEQLPRYKPEKSSCVLRRFRYTY